MKSWAEPGIGAVAWPVTGPGADGGGCEGPAAGGASVGYVGFGLDVQAASETVAVATRARRTALLPADPQAALEVRERDRFFDLYLHVPTQKVITDRMRPADGHDEIGVAQARAQLRTAYALLEREMGGRTWATGDDFTMADCAAAPPLFYSAWAEPLDDFPHVAAYRQRLMERPSFARALREAEPYLHLVPKAPA